MGNNILEMLKRELNAVKISDEDPRLQELSVALREGTLSYEEREDLNKLLAKAARPFLPRERYVGVI